MKLRRPRGTNDILPEKIGTWQHIENKIHQICESFGYQEIRTPVFEYTELFERGIGEATDIVEKEMYTFTDRGHRSITLRPEGTAPVVRAFIENKLYAKPLPAKLYYLGPMFRYEKPQSGRYRQFYQFGAEAIGSIDPVLDAEMIAMLIEFYKECKLSNFEVHINSLGCPQCRPQYRNALQAHFKEKSDKFCPVCQNRIDRNPMRVLDCKHKTCKALVQDIPLITEYLCPECKDHFDQVLKYLRLFDLQYSVDPLLVRGFDYYTKTIFEIVVPNLGAQNAVGGGGRYDGLVTEIGGETTPAIGFAVGLDRLILSLADSANVFSDKQAIGYVANFGGETKQMAAKLVNDLRKSGLWVEIDYLGRSLKAQMKSANKLNCRWVVIIGEEELTKKMVKVRFMDTGTETEVSFEKLKSYLIEDNEVN